MRICKNTLRETLAEMVKIADHKASIPILGTVSITPRGILPEKGMTVTATDLHLSLSRGIAGVNPGDLSIVVNAQDLYSTVKGPKVPKGETITISPDDNPLLWRVSNGVDTTLQGFPLEDILSLETVPDDCDLSCNLSCDELTSNLRFVSLAVSRDEARPELNGVYFDGKRIVGVDGHRLHYTEVETNEIFGEGNETIVPLTAIKEIMRLASRKRSKEENVRIYLHGDLFSDGIYTKWVFPDYWVLTAKSPDWEFPPYTKVIPSENRVGPRVIVERAMARKTLTAMIRTLPKNEYCLRGVLTPQSLDLEVVGNEQKVRGTIPVESLAADSTTWETLRFGVNICYFLDSFGVGSGKATISFEMPHNVKNEHGNIMRDVTNDPIKVSHDDGTAIVMIMKIW